MKMLQSLIIMLMLAFSVNTHSETRIEDSDIPIAGQTYFIESAVGNNNRFLSEKIVSRDRNRTLDIGVFDGGLDMKFTLVNAGEGFFYIRPKTPASSGKCLNLTLGNIVDISTCNNTSLQKWKFTPTNDGYYLIESKQTEEHLYVLNGNSREDTPVLVSSVGENNPAAKWKLHQINNPITFNREFNIEPIENLCPTRLMKGDREFGGNGPRVSGRVIFALNKNYLLGLIQFKARETKSDWSEVKGEWIKETVRLPNKWHINRVITPNLNSTFDYTTTIIPSGGHVFTPSDRNFNNAGTLGLERDGIVESIHFKGDTGGNDISDDNNCSNDTGIYRIVFKPVTLEITYNLR